MPPLWLVPRTRRDISSMTDAAPLIKLSESASQLSQTLKNALDDATCDAPVPVPIGAASLARVAALLERTVAVIEGAPDECRAGLRQDGLPRPASPRDDEPDAVTEAALAALGVDGLMDAARLLHDLHWFDAALPTSILAERVARLLRGWPCDALRELLGAANDLSADEKRAALAEPLCRPAAATLATLVEPATLRLGARIQEFVGGRFRRSRSARSVSLVMDGDDPFEGGTRACLERCDAHTLRELKAVSAAWQRRAREMLGDAASAWRQQPILAPGAKSRCQCVGCSRALAVPVRGLLLVHPGNLAYMNYA